MEPPVPFGLGQHAAPRGGPQRRGTKRLELRGRDGIGGDGGKRQRGVQVRLGFT